MITNTKDKGKLKRKDLGPTGPINMPKGTHDEEQEHYAEEHPNAGTDGKSIPVVPPAGSPRKPRDRS